MKPGRQKTRSLFEQEAMGHMDSLYQSAVYLTRNEREAEDLVQETFLKALRFFDRYEAGTNCKAWLYRIMMNTFINSRRNSGREKPLLDALDSLDVETPGLGAVRESARRSPEAEVSDGLLRERIEDALGKLPLDFRTVVVLADVQGLAYKEIADAVGCPVGTVMSRLHRGRRLMQRHLAREAAELGLRTPEGSAEEASAGVADIEEYRERARAAGTETGRPRSGDKP